MTIAVTTSNISGVRTNIVDLAIDFTANDVIELWSKMVMDHSLLAQITSLGQMLEVYGNVKVITVSNTNWNKQIDNIRRD